MGENNCVFFPPTRPVRHCLTAKLTYRRSFAARKLFAFALISLLLICVVAVLYVVKAFFLPVVAAFVVGTMLSSAAGFLERHRIPRAVSAVLIVSAVGVGVAFIVGLISSPLMEWSTRPPELGSLPVEKLHIFDRPLALWARTAKHARKDPDAFSAAPFQMPKFEWMQPAVEFLSPTFTEFLLFFATLVLFFASWRDLRRALIMTFTGHDSRLRTLRISQRHRGAARRLSPDRDHDQFRRRHRHRHHLRGYRYAQSGRARRAGRDLEFLSHHRPGRDVRDPDRRRRDLILDHRRRIDSNARIFRAYVSRRPFHHTDHHRSPPRNSTRSPSSWRSRSGPGCGDRWAASCRHRC